MPIRLSAAEFQKQFGTSLGNQVVNDKPKGPAIRLPKPKKMTKAEEEYGRILQIEFAAGGEVKFEAISFKLDGGVYSPDFSVWDGPRLLLCVEVKGSYRLHSAGRSHMAFKAARAAWPNIRWRFAQASKDGWRTVE
jgi:hypothetical protein